MLLSVPYKDEPIDRGGLTNSLWPVVSNGGEGSLRTENMKGMETKWLIQYRQKLMPTEPETKCYTVEIISVIILKSIYILKSIFKVINNLPHVETMIKSDINDLVDAGDIFFKYDHKEAIVVIQLC